MVKNPPANAGDVGLIPGSGRSPGEGNGNPLQHSCLRNSMDRGAWWATVHGVTKSRARLSNWTAAAAAESRQSCPTLRPRRRQPARLPRPWDSPGKNTGGGCHFRLQCMQVKSEGEVTQSCLTLSDPMDYSPPGSSVKQQQHIKSYPLKCYI